MRKSLATPGGCRGAGMARVRSCRKGVRGGRCRTRGSNHQRPKASGYGGQAHRVVRAFPIAGLANFVGGLFFRRLSQKRKTALAESTKLVFGVSQVEFGSGAHEDTGGRNTETG